MFPKHDDFAVRNVGLPGMIGALGACFGRVVTLDSPKARPPGDFNWGATLWHELAHVITLQMSKNRVPRWLTEGDLGVGGEARAPEWGREMEITFAHALNEGKTLKLDVLNEGFSDPKMISLAYYQASLVVEHIVDTYGEPKLRDLLRAYGEGLEDETAIKEALGASFAQLQSSFDARLEKQYADLRRALKTPELKEKMSVEDLKTVAASNPESFAVQMRLAQALHEAKDGAGAIAALERAAQLVPSATGANNPHSDDCRDCARAEGHHARHSRARSRDARGPFRRGVGEEARRARRSPRRRDACRGRLSSSRGDRSLRPGSRGVARPAGPQAQGRGDRRALVPQRAGLEPS